MRLPCLLLCEPTFLNADTLMNHYRQTLRSG